jgi:hypothetical protein
MRAFVAKIQYMFLYCVEYNNIFYIFSIFYPKKKHQPIKVDVFLNSLYKKIFNHTNELFFLIAHCS